MHTVVRVMVQSASVDEIVVTGDVDSMAEVVLRSIRRETVVMDIQVNELAVMGIGPDHNAASPPAVPYFRVLNPDMVRSTEDLDAAMTYKTCVNHEAIENYVLLVGGGEVYCP